MIKDKKDMRHIGKAFAFKILGCLVSLIPIEAYSQTDYEEAVDSVEMSDEDMDRLANVPIFLGEGRASGETDSVIQARYIIEQIPGKKFALYDGLKDTFVVDNMDHIEYNYSFVAPDSIVYSYFNFEKGIMRGLIGICTDNNEKVIMSEYNPKYVVDISECTTIDSVITEKCKTQLLKEMKDIDGIYGQIAVVDIPTGKLKAWLALRKTDNGYDDGEILYTRIAASHMLAPVFKDYTDTLEEEYNVLDIAVILSSLYCRDGQYLMPTLNGDTVTSALLYDYSKEVSDRYRKMLTSSSELDEYHSTGNMKVAGLYSLARGLNTRFDGKVDEISFGGCFPSKSPKYGIGIFIDKVSDGSVSIDDFSKRVNTIAQNLIEE